MIKSEIIRRLLMKNPHLRKIEIETLVEAVLDEVAAALARHNRVELRGFGNFVARTHRARVARNPRNGEKVVLNDRVVPLFHAGKDLRRRLNKIS